MFIKRFRKVRGRLVAGILLLLLLPNQASADSGALVRSLLIPGLGQAHQGHYTKASILAGSAIVSGFGLFLSQVYYKEAVNKYNDQKSIYASYEEDLANGNVVPITELDMTYDQMQADFNSAEDRLVWRNAFLVAFVATYAVNIIDVLISKPHKLEPDERLSLIVDRERVMVTRTFRF